MNSCSTGHHYQIHKITELLHQLFILMNMDFWWIFFFSFHITHTTLLQNQNQFHNQQREPQRYLPIFSKDFRDFASKNSFPSFDVLIREPTRFAFAFTFCPSVACNLTLIINQTNVLSSYNQSWKTVSVKRKGDIVGFTVKPF